MDKNEGIDGFGLFSFIKQQPPLEELNENLSSEDFDISFSHEQIIEKRVEMDFFKFIFLRLDG